MKNNGKILGIDLGTTNSVAAYYKDGKKEPVTISNFSTGDGDILSSVVGIRPDTKELIVGKKAKEVIIQFSENFIQEIKREMGKDKKFQLGNKELLPEEISGLILNYIKKYSEESTGENFDRAVITVPANFNDRQRNATKKAGELAGFKVERIINEPTAAALAYGLDNKDNKNIMVYDLGGGTFDVSVLELSAEILDIKASAGDNELGGKDFDKILLKHVYSLFKEENGFELPIPDNTGMYYKILFKCEDIKKDLSFMQSSTLNIAAITTKDGKPINLSVDISRSTLESLIGEKINDTEKSIDKALKDAKLKKDDIDTILLAGGSTRIPYVKELIERVMGKKPVQEIDPDRAVAVGAAIQGSIIDGETNTIIMDVCPFSLGIEVVANIGGKMMNGLYSEIIPSNYPLLKEKKELYYTTYGNQETVNIKVYQKNTLDKSEWVADNTYLGEQELSGIPPNEEGKEVISVYFTYNLNGTLDVKARIESTGKEESFQLGSQKQFEDTTTVNIEDIWQQSEKAGKIKSTIVAAEKVLNKIGEHTELEKKIYKLKEAVVKNDEELIEKLDDEITDLMFDLEEN
ncbi:MAG: Hsp70 family protein [Candidatus Tenebribacter davisii]|nr:Hsp70 family protein [Candidatus Tenebribacter davisii]